MAREKGMGNLQREKSGRWTMRVGINGKRYCRSTRTTDRDQAERVLQRFLAPLGLGDHRLPLSDVWLEYVKSHLRNDIAATTMNSKRLVWMHFSKWMEHNYLYVKDLGGITADMIAEYLACIRLEVSASTYNSRICILREMFRTLSKKACLDEDPWEGVRLRPEDSHSRRELTKDELKRLLAVARQVGSEWHALFLIGIYTGLRLGDCCRLDWSQINLAERVIQIIPSKTRRHHQRLVTIPIHPTLGQALLEVEKCPSSSGAVLSTIYEVYLKSSWRVGNVLASIFKKAGITMSVKVAGHKHRTPEASFHSLRHTFVSFAANAGVPLHVVQSIVGHESTAMTRHYYHENLTALQQAVNAIPALG